MGNIENLSDSDLLKMFIDHVKDSHYNPHSDPVDFPFAKWQCKEEILRRMAYAEIEKEK